MAEVQDGGYERAGGDGDTVADADGDGRGWLIESRLRLGTRLREIRRQQHLSLEQVEAASDGTLPTSLLGAYERGERTMTVLRLASIARFYRVPIDQLLPRRRPSTTGDGLAPEGDGRPALVVDLAELRPLTGNPYVMLRRYCESIREQRNDRESDLLTLRGDDRRVVAAMLDIALDRLDAELSLHGLLARQGANGALRRGPTRVLHLVRDD